MKNPAKQWKNKHVQLRNYQDTSIFQSGGQQPFRNVSGEDYPENPSNTHPRPFRIDGQTQQISMIMQRNSPTVGNVGLMNRFRLGKIEGNTSDVAKKLIYQNRTMQHNLQRLRQRRDTKKSQLKTLEHQFKKLKKAVDEIRQSEKTSEGELLPIPSTPTFKRNSGPPLMRRNTNLLLAVLQKSEEAVTNQSNDLQDLQQKMKSQRREVEKLQRRNDILKQMVQQLKDKRRLRDDQNNYANRMGTLQTENRELQNIIKHLSQVLGADSKLNKPN